MKEFNNEVIKISIDGTAYDLKRPKNKDVDLLMGFAGAQEGSDQFQQGLKFLINSGIPESVVDDMDLNVTVSLIEYLMPEKKE